MAAQLTSVMSSAPRLATRSCGPRVQARVPVVRPAFFRGASALQPTKPAGVRVPRSAVAVRAASDDVKLDLDAPNTSAQWSSVLAIAGFAAATYSNYSITPHLLLKAVSSFTLLNAGAAVVFREWNADHIASVAAPAALAVHALQLADVPTVLVGILGYYLCRELEGPTPAWLATLAAALYSQYAPQWFTAAVALRSLQSIYRGYQDGKLPSYDIGVVATSAWVAYKELYGKWTLVLALAAIFWSGARLVQQLLEKSDD